MAKENNLEVKGTAPYDTEAKVSKKFLTLIFKINGHGHFVVEHKSG